MKKYKNITRYEFYNKKGWYIRVLWKGKHKSKIIKDKDHGGKQGALNEAVKIRNKMEIDLEKPRTERQITSNISNMGIQKVVRKLRKGVYKAYTVFWSPEKGVNKKKFFNVKKLGDKKAKDMATKYRNEMVKKYYN